MQFAKGGVEDDSEKGRIQKMKMLNLIIGGFNYDTRKKKSKLVTVAFQRIFRQ